MPPTRCERSPTGDAWGSLLGLVGRRQLRQRGACDFSEQIIHSTLKMRADGRRNDTEGFGDRPNAEVVGSALQAKFAGGLRDPGAGHSGAHAGFSLLLLQDELQHVKSSPFTNNRMSDNKGELSTDLIQSLIEPLPMLGRRMPTAPSTSQIKASISASNRSQEFVARRPLFQPDRPLFRRVGRDASNQLIFGTFCRAKGGEIAMNLRTSL